MASRAFPPGRSWTRWNCRTTPTSIAAEIFVTVKHPVRGDFKMPGWPVKMSGSKVPITASPLLGADTDDVYSSLLGLSKEELAALREEKAI